MIVMTGINLWLDSYEDIYSDFDSRQYLNRRISEDFLAELQIELKNLPDAHNMILSLPREQRDQDTETTICDSLHDFFSGRFRLHARLCRQKLYQGLSFLVFGVMVMLLNSWIIYRLYESFLIICLKVLLEPAGWFLLWAGLDFLFYDFAGFRTTRDFYRALSEMKICFQSTAETISREKKTLS